MAIKCIASHAFEYAQNSKLYGASDQIKNCGFISLLACCTASCLLRNVRAHSITMVVVTLKQRSANEHHTHTQNASIHITSSCTFIKCRARAEEASHYLFIYFRVIWLTSSKCVYIKMMKKADFFFVGLRLRLDTNRGRMLLVVLEHYI